MVRVEFQDQNDTTSMRIEGRLVGHYAEDVRSVVIAKKVSGGLVVDLSDLSWADQTGEEVLRWLASVGCWFRTGNTYSSYVCEKLALPILHELQANLV